MSSNVLRLLTVMVGIAAVVAGFLVPGAHDILVPLGVGITGWGTPHPSDAKAPPAGDQ